MLVSVESKPLVAAALEMMFRRRIGPRTHDHQGAGSTIGHVILLEGDDYIGHA